MEVPEHAKRGRLNRAGCSWDIALCQDGLDALKRHDRQAWMQFQALIEEAEQNGLDFGTHGSGYSAPLGKRIAKADFRAHPTPWIGELRVEGRRPKRGPLTGNTLVCRLYFGEPDTPADLVLGVAMAIAMGRS